MPESKGRVDTGKPPSSSNHWTRYVWLLVSVVTTTFAALGQVRTIAMPLAITVSFWVFAGYLWLFPIMCYFWKITQTSRENWKEGAWIVVNIVLVTFATIGMVRTINIPPPVTVLLWVLAAYILVFQIVRGLWNELRKKIEGFAEPLREIASQKALYTVYKILVPERRAEEVLERLGAPVLRRTMDLQGTLPLETRLKMSFRGDREVNVSLGELLVVRRTISWTASLLKAETSLKQLVKPILVCTSYVRQIPWIRKLAEGGHIDLLWPIPSGWIEDEDFNNPLQEIKWLEFSKLKIGTYGDVKLDLMPKQGQPMSFDSIWGVLQASAPGKLPKLSSINEEDKKKLAKHCMQVLYIDSDEEFLVPSKNGAFLVFIDQESTYRVWVKGTKKDQILFRYEIPFLRPAFVQDITFELADPTLKDWILDPASVHCAFPLIDIDDKSRVDPERQDLCWSGGPEEGTPFLPGHGVAFMWRKKTNNEREGSSDS